MSGTEVAVLSRDEAQALTDRIKSSVEQVWQLLLHAYERQAHAALGYDTWESYVRAEFNMSRQRSYQLLDQGHVVRAIEAAVPLSTDVDKIKITEATAREIKPVLPEVVETIRERVASLPEPEPEAVRQVVADVVAEKRAELSADDVAAHDRLNAYVESGQGVKDARYASAVMKALKRAGELCLLDPERAAEVLEPIDVDILDMHARSVTRFADAVKRARSGLRVVTGGKA